MRGGVSLIDTKKSSVTGFAVNGAIHYARAIINEGTFPECLAIGVNGYEVNGELKTEVSAYYVSKANAAYPIKIDFFDGFNWFSKINLDGFFERLDNLKLSDAELEAAKIEAEDELERRIHKIHQELYDNSNTKALLNTDQKLYLFCGLIMAAHPIKGEADLEVEDLKGGNSLRTLDGAKLIERIELFLEKRGTPEDKKQIILSLLKVVFSNKGLNTTINGETHLKNLYRDIKEKILPCLTSNLHLDFTGKIFNKLGEWASISTDIKNDVVLTPRYVTNLMVQLARTDKDSYVLDSAMGSAGFLVSALEVMLKDAQNSIKFSIKNTSNLLSRDIKKNSGPVPYLCASAENNGVSSYISYDDSSFLNKGNCVFIGGKTFVVSYQEKDFFSNDSHNLALYLKEKKYSHKDILLGLATCINLSLRHKYSWGNSISSQKIKHDFVTLPLEDGQPDFEFLGNLTAALKKLVLKTVDDFVTEKTSELVTQ